MTKKFAITVQCVVIGEAENLNTMRKILKEIPLDILNVSGCHYKYGSYSMKNIKKEQKVVKIVEVKRK